MPQTDASALGATRTTVADRLMLALRPPGVSSRPLRWLGLAMLALAAIFPLIGGPFYTRLGIETLLLGSVALSVDILLGHAGLLSLGQAAYFGVAAYISALMYLHVTQSFWLVLLAVMAAVGVFSLLLGAVAIRAKGVYFALITFGAAEILSKIAHNTPRSAVRTAPRNSVRALRCFRVASTSSNLTHYVVLAAICLIYVGTRAFSTPGSAACAPFATMPIACRSRLQSILVQAAAYVMAAQIAPWRLIYPLPLASWRRSVRLRSLDQGRGDVAGRRGRTLLGPLVGSVYHVPESFVGSYTERHLLGVIFIVFVMFLPDGLCSLAAA